MSNLTATKILQILLTLVLVSGCAAKNLSYRLDPELTAIQRLAEHAEVVAVSVIDKRPQTLPTSTEDLIYAKGPNEEANLLKSKIIDNLKRHNFKIIGNELLADLAITIEIEQLEVKVEQSFFKSKVYAVSHLRLKANKKSQRFEKLYKISRNQEVANPANELDVTGVVNQMLSEQLTTLFSDPALINLANKQFTSGQ